MNTNESSNVGVSQEVIKLRREVQLRFQRHLVMYGNWHTCMNCIHYEPGRGKTVGPKCELAGKLPPPEIIMYGCEKHEHDDIPF